LQTIKINPSILTDLLKVIQNYQAKIPATAAISKKHITDTDQQKIQERYFKGVSDFICLFLHLTTHLYQNHNTL